MSDRGETAAAEPARLTRLAGALLFLYALALRLPMLPRHLLVEGDGVHYATLARAILAGDASGLANPYWSNLWPGVIAAVAALTRLDVVSAGRLASLLAGAALAPATAWLAARSLGKTTGLLAGLLVAAHPWLVHFSSLLFTESLFAFLLVMLLLSAVRRPSADGAWASGAWAGLALLTRPEAYAAIATVALDPLARRRPARRADAVRRGLLFLAVVLAFALGRALLIGHYGGGYDLGGTKATANLLVGLAESDRDKARVATEVTGDDTNALARAARESTVLDFMLAHPVVLARHAAINCARVVSSALRVFPFVPLVGGRPALWGGHWPTTLALLALGLSGIALFGLACAVSARGPARLLAATGVLYAAGLAPFTVHDRLVVALTPLFLVFLAHGLVLTTERLAPARARAQRGLALAAALVGPVSLALLMRAPVLDYAADPVVQRQAGEWLAAHYPQDTVFMTAAPCVDFYFHDAAHAGHEVSLPWADYHGLLEIARRSEVEVLAVPEWHLQALQHPAADALLRPEAVRNDLRLVTVLGGGSQRMLIYEVLSPRETP